MYKVTVKEEKTGTVLTMRICKTEKDAKTFMRKFINMNGFTTTLEKQDDKRTNTK